MKKRGVMNLVLMAVLFATLVVAQQDGVGDDPLSSTIWTKVIPTVQGWGSALAVLAVIYAAVIRLKGDTEKVERSNKIFIAVAVTLVAIWVGPEVVKWFIGLVTG